MVIEGACESVSRPVVSKVTSMAKDLRLCFQGRAIINRVVTIHRLKGVAQTIVS